MREDEAGRVRVPWRSNPIVARLTNAGTHLTGAVLLAAGVANTLAARRNRHDGGSRDEEHGKNRRDRDREDRQNKDQDESREERQTRREDRDVKREKADDSSGGDSDRNRNRDRKNDDTNDTENDTDSDVSGEQNNNNNNNQNNRNRDDEPNNNNDNDDESGGNNAGSAFFDSPLATKARRRAKDFDNQDRDEEDEGRIIADVDPEGESVYQTDSISFATGPDGIEINTGNITYIAAPTPTPTPMPRLELPERDGYPFGEDFPFGVARPEQTPTTTTTEPEDEVPDPGDSPPPPAEPVPTEPLPSDTDGGDNGMEFTS